MWGSDGTKIQTVEDGWVWVFSVMEHWNAGCMGWHVCKTGDRFAALEPVAQAVRQAYGSLGKGMVKGLKLRIDNGSQYTSGYFLQQLKYWGVESSFGLVRQPETNGVAERFHRTLKDQILDGRVFRNVNEIREAVGQEALQRAVVDSEARVSEPDRGTPQLRKIEGGSLKWNRSSIDVATEPHIARGDDASGREGFWEITFKRKFVLQKSVAVHFFFRAFELPVVLLFPSPLCLPCPELIPSTKLNLFFELPELRHPQRHRLDSAGLLNLR
jgi:transposase InsO family protein